MYRYLTYSDIPPGTISFIENVSNMNVYSLSMPEINNFLNDMKQYYEEQNQDIEDFIHD
jgi:hypothetical protein